MMLSNLLILPMLLPFLCALILVFLKNNDRISKYLYLGTMTITTIISLMLLIYVQRHRPITLDFGGWSAPFGIQFLGDSLSLIMVTTASFVITLIMAYGFGRGEHKANRYHLPSFILFLSVGVIGSFLTSDLFNLYVICTHYTWTICRTITCCNYLCCLEYYWFMAILIRYRFTL